MARLHARPAAAARRRELAAAVAAGRLAPEAAAEALLAEFD
jgi:hypothetical protein